MNNTFKRVISLVLSLMILLPMTNQASPNFEISAWGAIAVDADTGEVLYEKNPDKLLVPASITKVMTAYIMYQEIEKGNLTKDSLITVSPQVAKISNDKNFPASVPLQSGGQYTVDQLLKLIMLPSASAACISVAEHISGTEGKFVERMNQTAKQIGMNANFKNSHGAKPHYTTARGVATLIQRFIEEYPDILNYTSLPGVDFNGKQYNTTNKFIHGMKYEGVDGFKTGTITEARYCLASTAKKDGRRVISVVLGSSSQDGRYNDSKKILDYSFGKIKEKDIARASTTLEIINAPSEIRGNIEYEVKVKFDGITQGFAHNGKLYLDGELIKEIENQEVKNGLELNIPFDTKIDKKARGKDYAELEYKMEIPNGEAKIASRTIKLSDKEPALYKDLDNDEDEAKIRTLIEKEIMGGGGIGNGYFGYNNPIKRVDFIMLLGRIAETQNLDQMPNKDSIYEDIKAGDYYNKYVVWATEKGFISGYNNKFMPGKAITVEEAKTILNRFSKEYNIKVNNELNMLSPSDNLRRGELVSVLYSYQEDLDI